jgi:indole-3-glycerol phosphate synthase
MNRLPDMPDVLARICADTRVEVSRRKSETSRDAMRAKVARANRTNKPRGFAQAMEQKLEGGGLAIIAEIKRASPSGGDIRPHFDPAELALAYEMGGASCLSVLTDEPYFKGTSDDLVAARAGCFLPVLRKDFMLDAWQIHESRAMGADCVLLIMSVLSDAQAAELEAVAIELGMDVLLESHDGAELDRALALKSPLIGINNRNLREMTTDLNTTLELAPRVPPDRFIVGESGYRTHDDLKRVADVGVRRFLVGESLLRQPDLTAATKELLGT